ncbi:MAG: methyltransferase domain-containing protein [Ignavibacteriaceae bacterium]
MQKRKNIIDCYNKTAKNYAEKFINELDKKHLDKILLKSFAKENIKKGKLIDLGCGPGQTTKFLFDCGFKEIIGTDLSTEMINIAKTINPKINFETADILNLNYNDNFFGSAVAFYSIVHFDYKQIKTAFKEINKVLRKNGQFLFSFHIGNDIKHLDEFLEHKVNIDFYFFEVNKITELLIKTGFEIIDVVERQPYEDAEYSSRRAYIWVKKNSEKL